jgi:hypothetical protein
MSRNEAHNLRYSAVSFGSFNSDAYQNNALSVQNNDIPSGDHVVLFYCDDSLDQSETSMLDSAGLESHRPVNN